MQNETVQNQSMSPMGEHFEIRATLGGRSQKVLVTEIAASLRALEIDGVALLQDYPAQSGPPSCAGATSVQAPVKKEDADKRGGVKDPGGTIWWIAFVLTIHNVQPHSSKVTNALIQPR